MAKDSTIRTILWLFWRAGLHLSAQLTIWPLIVVEGVSLVTHPMNRRIVLPLLGCAAASWALMMIAMTDDVVINLRALGSFRQRFPDVNYEHVSLTRVLAAFRNSSELLRGKTDRELLSLFSYWQRKNITFVAPKSGNALATPSSLLAFADARGALIILKEVPEKMNSLAMLQLLHELGHTGLSFRVRAGSNVELRHLCRSLPFICLLLRPTASLAYSLLPLALWLPIELNTQRVLRGMTRVHDELQADAFLFKHCDPKWFKDYPAQRLAALFCGVGSQDQERYPDEYSIRLNAFATNIARVRLGDQPITNWLSKPKGIRFSFLGNLCFLSGMGMWGLHSDQMSPTHRLTFGVIVSLSVFWAILRMTVANVKAGMLEHAFGIRIADQRLVDGWSRGIRLRQKLIRSPKLKSPEAIRQADPL